MNLDVKALESWIDDSLYFYWYYLLYAVYVPVIVLYVS